MKKKDQRDETRTEKFGDLILWKEILRKAKENQRSILFITSDMKEDWWQLDEQRNIVGIHPMLVEEFVSETGLSKDNFLMLYTGKFFNLMFQQIQKYNVEEKIQTIEKMYSLNAKMIASEFFYKKNKIESIEKDLELEAAFLHDDELQEFISDSITDVEFCNISEFEIIDSVFYRNSENFVIESRASALCDINVDVLDFKNKVATYGYDVMLSFSIQMTIPIKSIEVEIEEDIQPIVRDLDEGDLIDIKKVDFCFYDLNITNYIKRNSNFDDICSECNRNYGDYVKSDGNRICETCSNDWDECPNCGRFYPSGSFIGAFCDTCEGECD